MTHEAILEKLNEIFRDIFDDDSLVITETTTANDVEDWDSIEHINLIDAVEKEFGMKFKMQEVSGMKNVGEMVQIIAERCAEPKPKKRGSGGKKQLSELVFTRNICGFSSIILLQTRKKYAGGLSVAIYLSATLLCSQTESCLERSRPASIFYAVCSKICRKDTCTCL